jgi:hypothetical protein
MELPEHFTPQALPKHKGDRAADVRNLLLCFDKPTRDVGFFCGCKGGRFNKDGSFNYRITCIRYSTYDPETADEADSVTNKVSREGRTKHATTGEERCPASVSLLWSLKKTTVQKTYSGNTDANGLRGGKKRGVTTATVKAFDQTSTACFRVTRVSRTHKVSVTR